MSNKQAKRARQAAGEVKQPKHGTPREQRAENVIRRSNKAARIRAKHDKATIERGKKLAERMKGRMNIRLPRQN